MQQEDTRITSWEKLKSKWLHIIIIIVFFILIYYSMNTRNMYRNNVMEKGYKIRKGETTYKNAKEYNKTNNETMKENSALLTGNNIFKHEVNNQREEYGSTHNTSTIDLTQTTDSLTSTPTYFNLLNHDYYRPVDGKNVINKEDMKYILYWDTFHGNVNMNLGLGNDVFKMCPVKSCMTTHNHKFMPEEKYDAIIFHGARWKSKIDGYPKRRNLNQKYIFFAWESPYNTRFDNKFYKSHKNFYNWTLTYRRDSDIHFPYGIIQKIENNYKLPCRSDYNKTIMAAWLVGNCKTLGTIRRIKYVEELMKYIQVDIYGNCTRNYCESCYELIQNNYYFYLAFENSMCFDYVTEKLYRTFWFNVVPIVLGLSNYKSIAPPHSFINTNNFSTPKLLVDYLIKLSENWDLYTEYFKWKKHYQSWKSQEYALCQMCEMLHRPIEYTTYEDIKQWYFGFGCYVR